jgi:hypothetical protein
MLTPLQTITTSEYIQVTNKKIKERIESIGINGYVKELLADHDYGELDPTEVSRNPWLYDPQLSDEETMFWKLKGDCHVCKISVRHHRDDCCFSANQLMFREYENVDNGLDHINKYINAVVGHKIDV